MKKKPVVLIVNWGTWGSDYQFKAAKKKGLELYIATGPTYPPWVSTMFPPSRRIITNTYNTETLVTDVCLFMKTNNIMFDAVTTFFEMNIIETAELAHTLGCTYLTPQSARHTSGNKLLMRLACLKAGIPSPEFVVFKGVDEGLRALRRMNTPVVIKPVKSGHSFGAALIQNRNKDDFIRLFNKAKNELDSNADEWMKYYDQHKDVYLMEQFMDGPVVSVDGLVQDNRIMICGITEFCMSPPPHFIQEGVCIPGNISSRDRQQCFLMSKRIVRATGINNTAFHCELRITSNGPMLIEIAGRPPGGKISLGYKLAYDVDIIDMYLDICLKKRVRWRHTSPKRIVFQNAMFYPKNGTLLSIEGMEKIKKHRDVTVFWARPPGGRLYSPFGLPHTLLYYQICGQSYDDVKNIDAWVRKTVRFRVRKTIMDTVSRVHASFMGRIS